MPLAYAKCGYIHMNSNINDGSTEPVPHKITALFLVYGMALVTSVKCYHGYDCVNMISRNFIGLCLHKSLITFPVNTVLPHLSSAGGLTLCRNQISGKFPKVY